MRRAKTHRIVPIVAVLLAACLGTKETPLDSLPDLVDGRNLAIAKVHPQGLAIDVSASLVEKPGDDLPDRSIQVTLHVDNGTGEPLRLLRDGWLLRDDVGRRFTLQGLVLWDAAEETYVPAPDLLAAGQRAILVARFPVGQRFNLLYLVELTLHWSYEHAGKKHKVATRFRSR